LSFSDALISWPYTEERNRWQGDSYYAYKGGAEEKINIIYFTVPVVFIDLVKWIY